MRDEYFAEIHTNIILFCILNFGPFIGSVTHLAE